MTPFFYTLLSLTLHCANRKELSPCTCKKQELGKIAVSCEKMVSFDQVVSTLKDKFQIEDQIQLQITYSSIEDLPNFRFQDFRMSIDSLKLNHNNISNVHEASFIGLGRMSQLYLSDNRLSEIPSRIFAHLPSLKVLDLGREDNLVIIKSNDFQEVPNLETLSLSGNSIRTLEENSLPKSLRRLHIGRNKLKSLNGTLRELTNLQWLFINSNNLLSLDNQFAPNGIYHLIHASDNFIDKLPVEFKSFKQLSVVFLQNNSITSLDEVFSNARNLNLLQLSYNNINRLNRNDFKEAYLLADLQLGHNLITNLNGSILPLRNLTGLNLNHNRIRVFDLKEIQGLKELQTLDLSYNGIHTIIGRMENQIESNIYVTNLILDHNEIKSLDRALNGLNEMINLNLSFNLITNIYPNDLIGLDKLEVLDISNNNLLTLEELSKTFLSSLHELRAQNNKLSILERDFYGLPTLCYANLANNEIKSLSFDLVSRTRCKLHGIPDILKINLQENPILCDNEMPEIIASLEVNYTKIVGSTDCEKLFQTLNAINNPPLPPLLPPPAPPSPSLAITIKPEIVTETFSLKNDLLITPEIIEIIEMNPLPPEPQLNLAASNLIDKKLENFPTLLKDETTR